MGLVGVLQGDARGLANACKLKSFPDRGVHGTRRREGQDDARDVIEQEMSTYQETIDSIPATAETDQASGTSFPIRSHKAPEEQEPTP